MDNIIWNQRVLPAAAISFVASWSLFIGRITRQGCSQETKYSWNCYIVVSPQIAIHLPDL